MKQNAEQKAIVITDDQTDKLNQFLENGWNVFKMTPMGGATIAVSNHNTYTSTVHRSLVILEKSNV